MTVNGNLLSPDEVLEPIIVARANRRNTDEGDTVMNNIVTLNHDGCPVTNSLAIAEGVDRPHKNVVELIRVNICDFESFGRVAFETRPFESAGGIQHKEVAILNEHQATLLITFMRNIGVVKEFKKRLVKAFFEMRDELNKRQIPPTEKLSRMEILQLAMQSEEERLRLEQEKALLETRIEQDAPRVEFAKQVEVAPDAISVAEAAKILGTGRKRLFAFLRREGWVTRLNEPYQPR